MRAMRPVVRALVRQRVVAVAALALLVATPALARAQANTAELLSSAIKLYDDVQVERAVAILRQVVSPSSPYEVSREQRVQAYKYLGASLALLNQRDSAVVYLRAALERDPFTDLDARVFTEVERNAFAEARARTFALAVRPVASARFDPRTEGMTATVLSTHAATLHVSIRAVDGSATAALYDGDNDGLRELSWNGIVSDGRLARTGRYALVVTGQSAKTGRADSTAAYFDVRRDVEALEDTLPSLGPSDLLLERTPVSAATQSLAKGLGVAAAAMLFQNVLTHRELGDGGASYARVTATAGAIAGVTSFLVMQHGRDLPANAQENRRRVADRVARNAQIQRRNADREARARLVVMPAAGAGQ